MNKFGALSILTSLLLATGVSAQAETGSGYDILSEDGTRTATLEHCQGTARLTERYVDGARRPLLTVSGVKNCSNIEINGEDAGKLKTSYDGSQTAEIVIYERSGLNVNTVRLSSNSGRTSDTIKVRSFGDKKQAPSQSSNPPANLVLDFGLFSSALGIEQAAYLPECGGIVRAKVLDAERLNLVFENLNSCSNFDILRANGDRTDYPNKKLQQNRNGDYSGSFTVPARFTELGNNSIKVIVKSNSGKHDDVILIRFTSL